MATTQSPRFKGTHNYRCKRAPDMTHKDKELASSASRESGRRTPKNYDALCWFLKKISPTCPGGSL